MYTVAKLTECFKTIDGFRNSPDPDVPQITDPDLLTSDSGRYYDEFHPLVKTDIISNIIPEATDMQVYLKEKVYTATLKVFKKFASVKKEMRSTKTILNSSAMFDGVARFNQTILNENKFVGFRITLKNAYGVKATIDRLGVQFNNPQTNLPIYLFHTSQVDPIKTVMATTASTNSLEWLQMDEVIDLAYYAETYDTGGHFFLGYYQNDVLGLALKKDFDFRKFCGGCAGRNAAKIWNTRLNFIEVRPMYVSQSNYTLFEMFDYRDIVITDDNNYGLNFATTISCDLTEYFCENKLIFSEAIGMQLAVDVLNDIVHSDRANRIAEVNRNMIIRNLEGDKETHEEGLNVRLETEIKNLDFDFSKIDSPCLPASEKYGVRVQSI